MERAGERERDPVGSPYTTQCTNVPPGASGSSTIKARLRVEVGGSVHDSGGDWFAPSQVKSRGIDPPASNAWLVSEICAPLDGVRLAG